MTDRARHAQRLARMTGLLYLIVVVFGMIAPIMLERVVVPGDAAATADRVLASLWSFRIGLVSWIVVVVADVAISAAFYLLLEPISRILSLVTAALRLVYSGMLGASLPDLFRGFVLLTGATSRTGFATPVLRSMALSDFQTFGTGFLLALVLFGIHLVLLGLLLQRSRYVPRALAVLLALAGVGYVAHGLATFFVTDYGALGKAILLTPAFLGEIGLTAWLLVNPGRVPLVGASEGGLSSALALKQGAPRHLP
jgi:Domain of unknown function (DUF4386)